MNENSATSKLQPILLIRNDRRYYVGNFTNHKERVSMNKKNMRSLTLIKNTRIVGRNNKSYNDKHPENPVPMRPIHDACVKAKELDNPWVYKMARRLRNFDKPTIVNNLKRLFAVVEKQKLER